MRFFAPTVQGIAVRYTRRSRDGTSLSLHSEENPRPVRRAPSQYRMVTEPTRRRPGSRRVVRVVPPSDAGRTPQSKAL